MCGYRHAYQCVGNVYALQVRALISEGRLTNTVQGEGPAYPQDRFDDPGVGPSVRQVNAQFVRPATRHWQPLPGVSYAIKLNLSRGGVSVQVSNTWMGHHYYAYCPGPVPDFVNSSLIDVNGATDEFCSGLPPYR